MYNYLEERPRIFTEEGQVTFLKVRDSVKDLLKAAGAARLQEIIFRLPGSSWLQMACVDRLVELGELEELPTHGMAQYRVFVEGGH